jgi:hypothetical protein
MFVLPKPVYSPEPAAAAAPAAAAPAAAAAAPAAAAAAAPAAGAAPAPAFSPTAPAPKPAAEPIAWGEDWREKLAGNDEKALATLKRYKTPEDWTKAGLEAQNRIRSARLSDDPMPDPTKNPEEARIWRAERGIPDEATDYKLDAVVEALGGDIPDAEKPLFADYMQYAHANGIGQKDLDKNLKWYANFARAQQEETAAADKKNAAEVSGALKAEWKGDHDANMGLAERAAGAVLDAESGSLFDARLPDGRRVGDVPGIVKMFHRAGVILYGEPVEGGGDGGVPPASELETLRKEMKTNIEAFESDPAKVEKYRKLVKWETEAKARRGQQ